MRYLLFFSLSFLLLFSCAGPETGQGRVTLLLTNGKVWTGTERLPSATWVAISGDRIHSVGGPEDNPPPADSTIDLSGRLLTPGFNDSHVHFASGGHLLLGINLLDVNEQDLFVQRIQETTRRLPKGSWITRGDWGAYEAWGMGSEGAGKAGRSTFRPDRRWIDEHTPDHPVLVTRFDRTEGLANAVALELLGLRSRTGLLRGETLQKALEQIPEPSLERRLAETERALEECRSWGVTTVQDMSALDQVDIYRQLRREGKLTCRINFSPSRLPDYRMMIERGWLMKEGEEGFEPAGDEWLAFGTLKTHIDGIMGARTARFFEPYADNEREFAEWRGSWREFSEDMPSFRKMLIAADSAGIQLRIHAIGDEANHLLLDLLDTLDRRNGPRDRRFRLVHAQVIAPEDFPRFHARKIVAEVQPYHVTDDMRWMEERIGYQRCQGAYAFRTLRANGCILSFGSDFPGTNASYYPLNPLMGIYAAVTRQTIHGEPEEGWFPEQRIELHEALRAYTWGPAYGAFEEHRKGTLEAGKLADIAVLDIDLFTTPPAEWLEGQVDLTIVGGEIVFARE